MTPDTIPAPVRALHDLFQDSLAEVKFPDVDAAALASSVARVDTQAADVARLEEELARARAAFENSRDELLRMSARAHAYARVYAEDDDVLRARVDAITLPRARPRPQLSAAPSAQVSTELPAPAPRRKKRTQTDEDAPLFLEAPAGDAAAE